MCKFNLERERETLEKEQTRNEQSMLPPLKASVIKKNSATIRKKKFENWSNAFENKLKQNSKSDTNKHASTPINNVKPSFELKNELLESELLNFSKDIQNMKVRKNENI